MWAGEEGKKWYGSRQQPIEQAALGWPEVTSHEPSSYNQTPGAAMPKTPSLVHLHGAAGVLEGEGAWPFLAMQAPHVNSLNKCSHFSQLIHPHVRMLTLCQPLNAASAPTARRSWRWNRLSLWSAVPLPTANCPPQVPGPPSSQRLALHKTKCNPGNVLKETLQSKGHYK